jgi:hypothetical protein
MLFFKNLENIGPFTEDDIDKYIALLDVKLDSNVSKSLRSAVARYIEKAKAVKVIKAKKKGKKSSPPPLPVVDDGDRKVGDGLKTKIAVKAPTIGRHGNLLYINKVLMKKLHLMIAEQDAGNNNLKKDISMFLDEAKKRGLIEAWLHKKTMQDYVLSKTGLKKK